MPVPPPNSFQAKDASDNFYTILWGQLVGQAEDTSVSEGKVSNQTVYTYKTVDGDPVERLSRSNYEIRSDGDAITLTGTGPEDV